MKGFIKVTDTFGNNCILNVNKIIFIIELEGGTRVLMRFTAKSSYQIDLKESMFEVEQKIKQSEV